MRDSSDICWVEKQRQGPRWECGVWMGVEVGGPPVNQSIDVEPVYEKD